MEKNKPGYASEPLQPFPQCMDCLVSLARSAAVLAADGNPRLQAEAEAAAREILEGARGSGLSSPDLANRILRAVGRLSDVPDPYARFKALEMAAAREAFDRTKGVLGEDLRSLASLAVLGNSLDFFKVPEETLSRIPEQLRAGLCFYHDDLDRLDAFLKGRPSRVLYLADNAGEIYFDLPLYDYVRKRCRRTVLVVKGGPAVNDLTRAELKAAGLEGQFDEVADTGTEGAGIDWEHVSAAFLERVSRADLILSKGMANFETLYPRRLSAPAFYLFKVKCRPIQDYIQAPEESYVALWEEPTGSEESLHGDT
jgi:uncharacterized protein with ATP-grasp and redox domains